MYTQKNPSEYMKVKIQTADPTELLVMLFDGAIRFTRQAKVMMAQKELDKKNDLLVRSQNIMLELIQALNPSLERKLYNNLIGLYKFCYERLLAANIENCAKAADEALVILEDLRAMWQAAIEKAEKENGKPRNRPMKGLSIEG